MANSKISALTSATTPLAGTETLPVVQSGATKQVSVADLTAGRAVSALSVSLTAASGLAFDATSVSTAYKYINFQNTGGRFYLGVESSTGGGLLTGSSAYSTVLRSLGATDLIFGTNTTEKLRIASGGDVTVKVGSLVQGTAAKGFDFSANTPAAGKTSTLLNWYEEGTFTPTIIGTTTAGTGTYSVQVGTYTRIGNMVRFNIALTWSAHTGTGNMEVGTLPFTSSSTANSHPVSVLSSNLLVPSSSIPGGMILASGTRVRLYTTPTSGTDASISLLALDTAATIWISGTYIV